MEQPKSQNRGRGGRGGRNRGPYRKNRDHGQQMNGNENPVASSGRQRLYSDATDDHHCSVCLNRIEIYAVGRCNHPVCGECSTRLRVICSQNECPICRQDLNMVVHTLSRRRFDEVENKPWIMDKKRGICFENEKIQASFFELLEHVCPVCPGESEAPERETGNKRSSRKFATFSQLDKHVRVAHDLYYCDLCTGNLKSFSHERRCYTRSQLATHRKSGDPDDKSHRGHPLCEFCQARFVDNDALFIHLRRDHFYCHFCDADGQHLYFMDVTKLKDHFKAQHYVCEEGECVNEHLTSAFRSEIDLKAHKLDRHFGILSKAAAKQNRQVDVELFIRGSAGSQAMRRRGMMDSDDFDTMDGSSRANQVVERVPDLAADFPMLEKSQNNSSGGVLGAQSLANRVAGSTGHSWSTSAGGIRGFQAEDFPSLSGRPSSVAAQPRPYQPQKQPAKPLQAQSSKKQSQPHRGSLNDFPSLQSESSRGPESSSFFSNFTSADLPRQYRNLQGNVPAWQSGTNTSNVTVVKSLVDTEPQMPSTNVSKNKKKEAAPPNLDDFPKLDTPQGNGPDLSKSSKDNKGAKNKKHKEGDNLKLVAKVKSTPQATLASAANIVFSEDNNRPKTTSNGAKDASEAKKVSKQAGDTNKEHKAPTSVVQLSKNSLLDSPSYVPLLSKQSIGITQKTKPVIEPPGLTPNQFPSLSQPKKKMNANFVERDIDTGAPGAWFGQSSNTDKLRQSNSHTKSKAPPGFGVSEKKNPPSTGYGVNTSSPYMRPSNFDQRNSKLLSTVMNLIGGKSKEFEVFKDLSQKFRSQKMSAYDYHAEILELMDKSTLEKFLDHLIVLLPNKVQQNELLVAHTSKFDDSSLDLVVCSRCHQIILPLDATEHESLHSLDADFPQLSLS